MPQTILFEGRTIQVPEDTSDEEIGGILSQGALPIQAAHAKPVDPRFFAPMPAGYSRPTSSSNGVDPRFFTTMDTSVAGEATDSGNVGQNFSASTLGMSLFYASQQDPGQYARLLHLQDLTGIPPIVSAGHEQEIQQAINATAIDPHYLTTIAPNTAVWASNPDNAAVSGADEIQRLGRIEQNAAAMRAVPSLNTFLNRYGSAAIPSSADDPQVLAWKRVNSFWGALGKGLVDPLAAIANQALARQHAGDSAYRATPRPEPATIAEEAQQATTPQTLQAYMPAAPTVAPLPTPAETAALIVRYPADAMAAVTYTDGKPDDPALLADIQKQQATDRDAEQNRRDAEDAAFFDKLPRLIPKDGGAPLTITDDEKRHVQQIMAQVQSGQRDPRQGFSPEEQELLMRYSLIRGGGAGEIENPVAAAIGQALRDKLSDMSRVDQLALMAALPEEGVVGQIAKLFFGAGMARGVYQGVPAAWKAYESGDNPKAAYITTGALVDLGMLGLTARHEASRVIDGLGYEQDASDGLGEGAREAMGGSVATEPSVDSAFFENLSQAMAEAADSKLRGRSPRRFYQALQAIFQGHDSLQIPVEQFNDYFTAKSMDPAVVARKIGADNYADAAATRGAKVEVPTEAFLGKLTSEHQQGLLPDVVDPASGMTLREHEGFQQWVAAGGPSKWQAELTQSAQEMAAMPEWQTIQENLRQRYVEGGQTADDAMAMATRDANVYSNLARKIGMQPSEMFGLRANLYKWGPPPHIHPKAFWLADLATEEDNATNSSTRIIPGDERNAPAIALSPGAYAYLRKQAEGLREDDWEGMYLRSGGFDILEDIIRTSSARLSAGAKMSADALVKTLRDNQSRSGGIILIQDGLGPWDEAVAVGEERMHHFQHIRPVPNDWLDKFPTAKIFAESKMALQGYGDEEWPIEISAKIMAGDNIGISPRNARRLRRAYRQALVDRWGVGVLQELPNLKGSRRRLNSNHGL